MSLVILHRRRGISYEAGVGIASTDLINDPNLRAYYQFDGNGNDYFGNYNAVINNNVTFNPEGKFGRSAVLNGLDAYLKLPDSVTYNLSQTICFWEKTQNTLNMYSKGSDAVDGWGVQVRGDVVYIVTSGQSSSSVLPVNHGTWRHKAVTIDIPNKELKVFINGVLDTTNAINTSGTSLRGTTDVYLGAFKGTSAMERFYEGEVSDFGIFERILTEAEIQQLAGI